MVSNAAFVTELLRREPLFDEPPVGAGPQVVYGPVGTVPAASDGRAWVASHLAARPG